MTDYPPATAATYAPQRDTEDPPLKDKATDVAQAAKQAGADVAQTANDKAKDVAQETSKQARDLVGEAREQVRQQAGAQHRSLVNNLRSLGTELDNMSARAEQPGVASEAVSQLRDRVHGAADWLDGREPGDIVEELRSFARRRPGVFLLGAVAAGVVAGRLTRGVVAAHADDSDATSPSQPTSAVQPAAATTTQFPATGGPASDLPGYSAPTGNGDGSYGTQPGYAAPPAYGTAPAYGTQPGYGTHPGYGSQPAGGYPETGPAQNMEAWR